MTLSDETHEARVQAMLAHISKLDTVLKELLDEVKPKGCMEISLNLEGIEKLNAPRGPGEKLSLAEYSTLFESELRKYLSAAMLSLSSARYFANQGGPLEHFLQNVDQARRVLDRADFMLFEKEGEAGRQWARRADMRHLGKSHAKNAQDLEAILAAARELRPTLPDPRNASHLTAKVIEKLGFAQGRRRRIAELLRTHLGGFHVKQGPRS